MEFHIGLGKGLEFFIADLRLLAGLLIPRFILGTDDYCGR